MVSRVVACVTKGLMSEKEVYSFSRKRFLWCFLNNCKFILSYCGGHIIWPYTVHLLTLECCLESSRRP